MVLPLARPAVWRTCARHARHLLLCRKHQRTAVRMQVTHELQECKASLMQRMQLTLFTPQNSTDDVLARGVHQLLEERLVAVADVHLRGLGVKEKAGAGEVHDAARLQQAAAQLTEPRHHSGGGIVDRRLWRGRIRTCRERFSTWPQRGKTWGLSALYSWEMG